jgi:transposase
MSKVVNLGGEVNLSRPKRRQHSVDYKLRILNEVDACKESGQVGAILRREGLYYSNLQKWREQRQAGLLDRLSPVKPGPKPKPKEPMEAVSKAQAEEISRLKRKLKRAEILLEIQKKASELMGMALDPQLLNESDQENEVENENNTVKKN